MSVSELLAILSYKDSETVNAFPSIYVHYNPICKNDMKGLHKPMEFDSTRNDEKKNHSFNTIFSFLIFFTKGFCLLSLCSFIFACLRFRTNVSAVTVGLFASKLAPPQLLTLMEMGQQVFTRSMGWRDSHGSELCPKLGESQLTALCVRNTSATGFSSTSTPHYWNFGADPSTGFHRQRPSVPFPSPRPTSLYSCRYIKPTNADLGNINWNSCAPNEHGSDPTSDLTLFIHFSNLIVNFNPCTFNFTDVPMTRQ